MTTCTDDPFAMDGSIFIRRAADVPAPSTPSALGWPAQVRAVRDLVLGIALLRMRPEEPR